MNIRPATHDDIRIMVAYGEHMHRESRYSVHAWNAPKVHDLIEHLILSADGLALVAEQDGVVIAGFLGTIGEHYFTNARVASDYALFVLPGKRGGRAACELIQAYVVWARSRSADMVQIGTTTGVKESATCQLFERCGFERVGQLFEFKD